MTLLILRPLMLAPNFFLKVLCKHPRFLIYVCGSKYFIRWSTGNPSLRDTDILKTTLCVRQDIPLV